MKRILVHHNFKRETIETKLQVVRRLENEQFDIVNEQPELVISIGGDGTMLNAIRKHGHLGVPFIGINTGSLGFLPTLSSDELDLLISSLKNESYHVSEYPIMQVTGKTVKGQSFQCAAFNEVIIKQADPRIMKAKIHIDDYHFNNFSGDGLIISTAMGSTGYAIWAGGAAVHPSVGGVQIVPINANDNAINHPLKTPLIIPQQAKIEVVIEKPMYSAVVAGCDGIKVDKYAIKNIVVTMHAQPIKILRTHPFNYYCLYDQKIVHKKG